MSISDHLDEIQRRSDDSTDGPWWGIMISGRCEVFAGTGSGSDPMLATELLPGDAEFVVNARTDLPRLVAALRAVLDVCDGLEEAHRANPDQTYEHGLEEAAHQVRNAVEAALGEES